MSHSVPSDSSHTNTTFPIGIDLVGFDRHDLPIYASQRSLWAEAGTDSSLNGASVDCVYDVDGETYLASLPIAEEPREIVAPGDDPLVALPGFSDGLILPGCEDQLGFEPPAHDAGAIYDFSGGAHVMLPMHDGLGWGLGWDLAKPEWFYDHHI